MASCWWPATRRQRGLPAGPPDAGRGPGLVVRIWRQHDDGLRRQGGRREGHGRPRRWPHPRRGLRRQRGGRAGKGGKVTYYDNQDFGLARYLPGGTLDTSFGSGGKVATNISTYTTTDQYNKRDDAQTLAVQDDGKIIVGGKVWTGASTMDAVLVRYTPNGTLDTSFGQGGIVRIATPNFNHNGVWDVAIQRGDPTDPADDKIVTMEAPNTPDAAGNLHWSMQVARYNLDGTLDTTFGTVGRTTTTMPGQLYAWSMALQADSSIVLAGDYDYRNGTPSDLMLARYTATGVPVATFGNNGVVLANAGGTEYGRSVAIQPGDGKIVVAGYTSSSALVARFQADGSFDFGFGNQGVARQRLHERRLLLALRGVTGRRPDRGRRRCDNPNQQFKHPDRFPGRPLSRRSRLRRRHGVFLVPGFADHCRQPRHSAFDPARDEQRP